MNNNNSLTKEEFAAELMKMGLQSQAFDLLGKQAPTPIGLASTETEKQLMKFLSVSDVAKKLKQLTRRWSMVEDPVLITGESGTGKELIARALHGNRAGAFVDVNCAGFISNESLMDSEIFGHRKGAFTGADNTHFGYIKAADNGTVFFDEIGELPMKVQSKLLRVLQESLFYPVGSSTAYKATCRFIFATHEDIERLVSRKLFREDLYYRISFGRLHIPPLRDRLEDAELILKSLFAPIEVPGEVRERVMSGGLKGNVRELQQEAKRWMVERCDFRV